MTDKEKKTVSRRRFLEMTAVTGTLGLAASACAPKPAAEPTKAPAAATATPKPAPTATPVPAGPKSGGILNYAETGEFEHFSPWRMSAVAMQLYDMTFDRLIWKDDKGGEHAGMAESWEMADDGLSFTINLKDNLKWHDGKDFTAQDFVNMYGYTQDEELVQDPAVKKVQDLVKPISDVVAVDPATIRIEFPSPVPYITDIIDYMWCIRFDDRADPGFMQNPPIGTGPFKMVEWAPNQYTKYEKHDQYYAKGLPYLDGVMFNRLDKAETLIPNLESGAVDGIYGPPPADVERLLADDRWTVEINDAQGSVYNIIVNTKLPPFDKKEVRQAMVYSLDRETILKNAFFGVGEALSSIFYSPASMAYRKDLHTQYPFDLDKAAKLLEDAGVKDLEIDIHPTPRWPGMKLFCLIWQADLAKIGVTLNVQEVENARFYEIGGDGDLLGFALHPWLNGRTTRDPAIFLGTQANYRGGAGNRYGWVNDELEKLVDDAAVGLDIDERTKMYQRCNEILTEELPMINVVTNPRIFVWNKDFKDVHYDLIAIAMLDKAWFDR